LGLDTAAWAAYLDGLRPAADRVERLAPALAGGGANAEYPWQVPHGDVVTPCQHGWPDDPRRDPDGQRFLRLLRLLLDSFEELM
jgi:hypothetical protein